MGRITDRLTGSGVVALAIALGASGCDGSDAAPAGGAGSGAAPPDGGIDGVREACLAWCEKEAESGCPGAISRDQCPGRCDAIPPTFECGADYAKTRDCIAHEATFTCLDEGRLGMQGCWTVMLPYFACTACIVSTSDDACDRCRKTTCCAELKAYFGHPDLGPYYDCVSACGEQDAGACVQECTARFPNLGPASQAWGNCALSCSSDCG